MCIRNLSLNQLLAETIRVSFLPAVLRPGPGGHFCRHLRANMHTALKQRITPPTHTHTHTTHSLPYPP